MTIALKRMKKEIREKEIEKYLIRRVRSLGGEAYKFTSPGRRAVPDRLCVFPKGIAIFVECKRPHELPTPLQNKEINRLLELGQTAIWVDSKSSIDETIETIKELLREQS